MTLYKVRGGHGEGRTRAPQDKGGGVCPGIRDGIRIGHPAPRPLLGCFEHPPSPGDLPHPHRYQPPVSCILGRPGPPLPVPPSHFVGRNVRQAAQGGLEEPKELQWPLQGPERHDAALGRLDAEGRGCWHQWRGACGCPGFSTKESLSLGVVKHISLGPSARPSSLVYFFILKA